MGPPVRRGRRRCRLRRPARRLRFRLICTRGVAAQTGPGAGRGPGLPVGRGHSRLRREARRAPSAPLLRPSLPMDQLEEEHDHDGHGDDPDQAEDRLEGLVHGREPTRRGRVRRALLRRRPCGPTSSGLIIPAGSSMSCVRYSRPDHGGAYESVEQVHLRSRSDRLGLTGGLDIARGDRAADAPGPGGGAACGVGLRRSASCTRRGAAGRFENLLPLLVSQSEPVGETGCDQRHAQSLLHRLDPSRGPPRWTWRP
jgi:hypothetical protein